MMLNKIRFWSSTAVCHAIFAALVPVCAFGAVRVEDVPGLIHVPITRQATEYTCGAAALASVLHWIDPGLDFTENKLARELKSDPGHGTRINEIESFAAKKGLFVASRDGWTLGELEKTIRSGQPVIVLIQAYRNVPAVKWKDDWDDGHYVVVNGIDARNVYMMDPSNRGSYTYIPRDEFVERWHDVDVEKKHLQFGMTISDPRKSRMSSYDRDTIQRLE